MNDSIFIHLPETREELFSSPAPATNTNENNTSSPAPTVEEAKSETQIPAKEETVSPAPISTQTDTSKESKSVVSTNTQKTENTNKALSSINATKKVILPKIEKFDITPKEETKEVIAKSPLAADTLTTDSPVADNLVADSLAADSSLAVKTIEQETPKKHILSIDGTPRVPTVSMSVWYTPFILALFFAYSFVISVRVKAVKSEIQAFFNPSAVGSMFSAEWKQNSPYKFTLSCAGIASIGLFAYFATHAEGCTLHSVQILVCIAFTALYCMLKYSLINLLQYTYFPEHSVAFSSAFMTIIRLTGICLIPSVLMMSYAPDTYFDFAQYLGFGVIIIAKILMIGKAGVNFFNGIASVFYLFLYLCTLEALPIVGICAFLMNIKYIF